MPRTSSSSDAAPQVPSEPAPGPMRPTCVLDRDVVTADSLQQMHDLGLSFFAPLCGANRGAFVLDPPDGATYSCLAFPADFAARAGVAADAPRVMNLTVPENVTDAASGNVTARDRDVQVPYQLVIKDANTIKDAYQMGNVTAAETLDMLDYFIQTVYRSSPNTDKDPYACNVNGLARLQCAPLNALAPPLRAATLAGLFLPAPWATGGRDLTADERDKFYTRSDFDDMRALGLNAVQIPVPLGAFRNNDEDDQEVLDRLGGVLHDVGKADLRAIVVLVGSSDDGAAVAAAARYAAAQPAVFALTLPSLPSLAAARAVAPDLRLMVPVGQGDLARLDAAGDRNVIAALDLDHTSTVADIASSNSQDDRGKLFYHEATACVARSPLEYTQCYRHLPVFVANGFDLSIDNCVHRHDPSVPFVDYGQCGRFDETVDSGWWARHRRSFAARQLFSYEHGLGWSYAAWKLFNDTDAALTGPASLLALRNVAAAGLFPALGEAAAADVLGACLNGPEPDFVLGDETLAPTMGPPPDCPNNGWWNYTAQACEYWVPPPTDAPSARPTPTPVVCPELPPPAAVVCSSSLEEIDQKTVLASAGAGCLMTLLLVAILSKVLGRRQNGYTPIPSANIV